MLMTILQTVNHLNIRQKIIAKTEERPQRPAQSDSDQDGKQPQ